MIRFEQVSFGYEKDEFVLISADMEIKSGLTFVVGPNGCGKSTLLKLAAGVEMPDKGRVLIDRLDLWKAEVEARKRMAYLPEQPDLTPYATLKEILRLVCRLRCVPIEKGLSALDFFGLSSCANRSVRELSMGERKRAVWATLLVGMPQHFILDEPLETLDRGIREEMINWISRRVESGASVVIVSHEIEPFFSAASQVVTIKDGKSFLFEHLPSDRNERFSLLEQLARGRPILPAS